MDNSKRATITATADGEGRFIRNSASRRQYGHVRTRIEPNQKGKGIEIIYEASCDEIPERFSNSVTDGVRVSLGGDMVIGHPAVDGHPIDDIIVHVVGGSFHKTDSSDLAFKMAAIFAMRDAMKKAEPVEIK